MKKYIKIFCLVLCLFFSIALAVACSPEEMPPTFYEVIFDGKGCTAPAKITDVEDGSKITKPEDPELYGFIFEGWYLDENTESEPWDWENDTVTKDLTLYAKWRAGTYIFEAEDTDLSNLSNLTGWGKPSVILQKENIGASGDKFVSYLYDFGRSLTFHLTCDKDVTDAVLVLSLSAEARSFVMESSDFTVSVNGVVLNYEPIEFKNVPALSFDKIDCLPFEDFVVGTNLTLNKGENFIQLMTTNNNPMDGTTIMSYAPLVDCIKITASAVITWDTSYGLPVKKL